MRFDSMYRWEKLEQIKGMTFEQVDKWLEANGLDNAECNEAQTVIYVDGYWADLTPIIEFKDGVVDKWYRGGCWD